MPELESIFSEAIALQDPAEQRAFLDRSCQHDARLKNRVGALLRANRSAGAFMDTPAAEVMDWDLADGELQQAVDAVATERPGDVIGRYRLQRSLGEGGMGSVYLADQLEPVQRQVALKVIKAGFDTREVIARFESERQALALMDHPNIARAYDAGATPAGRPYFVMEFIDGKSLVDFCNEQQLSTNERLDLFLPICDAIQYAHGKGIIHRDIKPQNILVGGCEIASSADPQSPSQAPSQAKPQPKVIDFGIAKATGTAWSESFATTRHGQLVGTPAYMSPEQADAGALDIDTRSDVYSLGATLYELLVGAAPFSEEALKQKSNAEIYRVIREQVPVQPSAAVSTHRHALKTEIAAARKATPQELQSTLSGDLDWIVMRALEKDRDRRYSTAAALADDLRRYLANEPVTARPPSVAYRAQKFVMRHRAAVASAAVVAFALITATCVSAYFAYLALQSSHRAETQAAIARQENEALVGYQAFLHEDVFGQANPFDEPDRNVPLRFVLDRAAQRLAQQELRPDVRASIQTTLGQTYRSLGELEKSLEQLRPAYETLAQQAQEQASGAEQAQATRHALAANELAATLLAMARLDDARELLDVSAAIAKTHSDVPLQRQTDRLRASCFELRGDLSAAERILSKLYRDQSAETGTARQSTQQAAMDLAHVYQLQGRITEALDLLVPVQRQLVEADSLQPAALRATVQLARLLVLTGDTDRATALYEQSAHDLGLLLGDTHPSTLTAKHGLALLRASSQGLPQAIEILETVLIEQRKLLGNDHPSTLATMHNLARLRSRAGDRSGAQDLFEENLEACQTLHGRDHAATRQALSSLAFFYLNQGQFTRAIPYYTDLRKTYANFDRADHQRISTSTMLGLCHLKVGDLESAKRVLEETLRDCEETIHDDWITPVVEGLFGEVLFKADERTKAEVSLVRSYERLKQEEIDLPASWRPLGLRAATRRLAEFYASSNDAQQRERAADYRAEFEHIGKFGSISTDTGVEKTGHGDDTN